MNQAMIDVQNEAVEELVRVFKGKATTTFKAPTGSGKTYMMADFMHRILSEDSKAVFVVSSLSKGNLAQQNYQSFMRFSREGFHTLKPYLIESDADKKIEGALYIPTEYNVYVLPRDLYKEKSRLKQGGLVNFLRAQQGFSEELRLRSYETKRLYLIKDECHIATNNLDSLIKTSKGGYFEKTLNISATPKLTRGQSPDVLIGEDRAIESRLIKDVEYYDDEGERQEEKRLAVALKRFMDLKQKYLNLVGINPCLIIQISNKDKAEQELKVIKNVLGNLEFSHLKYMYISENAKQYDSNDELKAKKLAVEKWRNYTKENNSTIDIVIFKMVISEGWDIPRACMLYQIRDTQSTQLTEQVIGRIRRNPRLLDFETLNQEQKELITKAYVYGTKPQEQSSISVKLRGGEYNEGLFRNAVQEEFRIQTTRLKHIEQDLKYNQEKIESILKNSSSEGSESIFTRYQSLSANKELQTLCAAYCQSTENEAEQITRWFKLSGNVADLKRSLNKSICNYDEIMVVEPPQDSVCESVLPLMSVLSKSEHKESRITKWIWESVEKGVFYFDSKAEKEWMEILLEFIGEDAPNGQGRLIKCLEINKEIQEKLYLVGKNFLFNSRLKFEYYLDGYHFSYPDFVLKDWQDRIHIFEVKSVRGGDNASFDTRQYKDKQEELKKCYQAASKKLPYYFYIPTQSKDGWNIWCAYNGEIKTLSEDGLKEILRKELESVRIQR